MADPSSVAEKPTSVPSSADIERAEKFTRERFVHPGEEVADALAGGSGRRRALDEALAELDGGAKVPSTHWRRHYSLLLGLERVLSEDEPRLEDGTLLNPHQVDALSGTLTALLAAAQLGTNGNGHAKPVAAPAPVLAVDDAPDDEEEEEEDQPDFDPEAQADLDEDIVAEAVDDPNAGKRFWFEHATGAGKSVAALGFVEATRTGGVLILTHRRNLVDQFTGELNDRGYKKRIAPPLLQGEDRADGPVTVETYQWFVRNAGKISDAYTIVICDEAHTALGEKTSAAIRAWTGPIFIGMTATGALIARHVTDLFPTQTSRFDLAQAARRGVIAPLRCTRIPPGPGVRTIAKVPLRRGDVDVEFDQEMLAELLDQMPFNLAIANLYKTRFNGVPGVVYAAGVRHAMNVAEAFREEGIKAEGVSGETPKRQLAEILAAYERGDIDVLVNAQLLAEGWNSPRATICMHLAPTASRRIYQQRVGRVTRRHPGKEAGIVVDFVHPATKHDDPVVTLHSLLDRDVYRGGAIVVGPVRRGRGRRVRVERRVIPVVAEESRRIEVFERELWRIAVEHLDYGEQIQWAALAGARVNPSGWRRARAMLHFDKGGELKRAFLLTAVQRNKHSQLRLRALQDIVASKDAEAVDLAIDEIGKWSRDEKREASKVMLQALAEKRIGRRDQANAWIWRLAFYTRELHEEYAVARWPETKRLLGLLVNSSGAAHARNARRLIQAARKQDRRLSAALLAAALAHTPEAEEALRGARTRMARKPNALARELLRNFPKGRRGRNRRRKKGAGTAGDAPQVVGTEGAVAEEIDDEAAADAVREAAALLARGELETDDEVEGALFDDEEHELPAEAAARDQDDDDDHDALDPGDADIDEDEVEEFVEESDGLDLDDDGEPDDIPDSEEVEAPDPADVPDEDAHSGFESAEDGGAGKAGKADEAGAGAAEPASRRKPAAKKPAAPRTPTAKKPAAERKPSARKPRSGGTQQAA